MSDATGPENAEKNAEQLNIRANPRRAPLHPDISEDMIHQLVHSFYDQIRVHDVLGPIFAAQITGDWEPHLAKMCDFWSSVTRMSGRYKGKPMQAHFKIPDLTEEHFEIWLGLFRKTAHDVCPDEIAEIFIDRAEHIAQSLQLGLFFRLPKAANAERPAG